MSCDHEVLIGAYLIDALEPAENDSVRAHLDECPQCRIEAASLERTVALLALLDPDEVEQLQGDDSELPSTPRRSHRRTRTAVIMSAVAAATATVLVGIGGSSPRPHETTVTGEDPITHTSATITVTPRSWGSELHLNMRGAYPNGWCSLVVRSRNGSTDVAATWLASPQGTANVPGATSIAPSQLGVFDVITDAGQRLVQLSVPH